MQHIPNQLTALNVANCPEPLIANTHLYMVEKEAKVVNENKGYPIKKLKRLRSEYLITRAKKILKAKTTIDTYH